MSETPRPRAGASKPVPSSSSHSPFLRQRPAVSLPQPRTSQPRKSSWGDAGPSGSKSKELSKGKGKAKVKAKWEVGTKGWVKEGFRKFGEHCARNQIRTLLIDCLVMTNLFYPSVAVWYQKRSPARAPATSHAGPSRVTHLHGHEDPLSLLSTPLLDSFFPDPPSPIPPFVSRAIWDTDTTGETGWNGTRLPRRQGVRQHDEDEIRLVRVGWTDVAHISRYSSGHGHGQEHHSAQWLERDSHLLASIRDMVERWKGDYPGSREHCVRELISSEKKNGRAVSDGACVERSSRSGSGNESDQPGQDGGMYHHAEYFMRIPPSSVDSFHARWQASVQGVVQKTEGAILLDQSSRRVVSDPLSGEWRVTYRSKSPLGHHTDLSSKKNDHTAAANSKLESRYSKYFILFYLAMFVILASQVNFATRVHSKFGLVVTGIVQLCCSAIMSLSVLALIGWNGWGWSSLPSSVPVWVLPMVIVIVGVENMSTLTKAVFSVPFHYSVPERIGLGLSRSGLKILFTSLTNILALAIIWYLVDVVPVREFCLFAITVNITDWFMLHTFYLTVISIDAQRLELADVLATSGNQDPATQTVSTEEPDDARYILSWRGLLTGRMFKSGKLFLTLICVGLIYLVTGRGVSSLSSPTSELYNQAAHMPWASSTPTPFATTSDDLATLSESDLLWRSINPRGWSAVDIAVPPVSVVLLPTPGHPASPADIAQLALSSSRPRLPRLKAFFYLFKVVILPQALTAGSLWALLLYLLKDADLLDAQRDRLGRGEEVPLDPRHGGDGASLASRSSVNMLPCGHAYDIERIAVSRDGSTVVTVGLDDSIALWRLGVTPGTGTREILKLHTSTADSTVSAVAVDAECQYVAAALADGQVQIWRTGKEDASRPLQPTRIHDVDDRGPVIAINFEPGSVSMTDGDPFRSPRASLDQQRAPHPRVTVMRADGAVLAVTESSPTISLYEPHDTSARALALTCEDAEEMAMINLGSHDLRVLCSSAHWSPVVLASHASPGDRVSAVSPLRQSGHDLDLLAVGRYSGLVEIFDVHSGDVIASVGQGLQLGPIGRVDLALPDSIRCTGCGTTSTDGFTVISSFGHQVYVDRVMPPSTTVCRCHGLRRSLDESGSSRPYPVSTDSTAIKATRSSESLVVPPDSARAKLSPSSSPRRSPSLLPPVSNGEFPLSSHGTRKLSAYQAHDGITATPTSSTHDRMPTAVGSVGLSAKSSMDQTTSTSTSAQWLDMEVLPFGAVVAESDGWTVNDDVLIGLRRTSSGIGHEQWQLWTIDLRAPYNGSTLNVDTCSLASLEEESRVAMYETLTSDGDQSLGGTVAQQRAERLASISGRATFPSIRGSFSVPTFPPLAYIDVRTMMPLGTHGVVAAFGNQLGVITLPSRTPMGDQALSAQGNLGRGLTSPVPRTPRSRLSSTSGLDKRPSALGLTPPPPRKVSEDRKAS